MALEVDELSRRKKSSTPSEYAAFAASVAAIFIILTVTNLPFHARPVSVLVQKNGEYLLERVFIDFDAELSPAGNSPFTLKQTIPDDIAAVQKRLRIETAIQLEAEKLERQVPRLSRLEATYHDTVQVEDGDEHADAILENRVKSLAEESVDKRAQAVIDLMKVQSAQSGP
jgi:hypothetical protein